VVKIPYGKGFIGEKIHGEVEILQQKDYPPEKLEVERAISSPIASNFSDFKGCESLLIVVNDQTRPVPLEMILKKIMEKVESYKIEDVRILIGGGLHTNIDPPERLLGEVVTRVDVLIHEPMNKHKLKFLGSTKLGTPIWINKNFLDAEKRLVVGMIDPHQFVGYTGGAKGVAIGISGHETIEKNHSLMLDRNARLGKVDGNPVREDIEEIGSIAGIDVIVNVILNRRNEVIRCVAGHWFKAYRMGIEFAKRVFEVRASFLADVVIASPGGHPKDIDVYQAQKSLSASEIVCKPGGVIVLVAECPQGLGNEKFEETMKKFETPAEVVEYFKKIPFTMGVHKAYLWSRTLLRNKVIMVSDGIDDRQAEILMVDKAETIEEALKKASKYTKIEKITVLPRANSIVPIT
jgi:nickel-dependent lactate racemase